MKRSAAYVVVLLIVVVIAAVLSINILFGPERTKATEPPQGIHTPVPETEAPTPATQTETPKATETPAPTPTETPVIETRAPLETPEPTPTEAPLPVDAGGSFSSATGTYLNLVVDWAAYTAPDGSTKLRVDLSASSYSFFTSALYQGLELTVGGQTYTANSPEISYGGPDLITTPMASFTVDAPTGNVGITAVWHYRGSYSGVELDDITASGTAFIG